jgi:hypothetical protein
LLDVEDLSSGSTIRVRFGRAANPVRVSFDLTAPAVKVD